MTGWLVLLSLMGLVLAVRAHARASALEERDREARALITHLAGRIATLESERAVPTMAEAVQPPPPAPETEEIVPAPVEPSVPPEIASVLDVEPRRAPPELPVVDAAPEVRVEEPPPPPPPPPARAPRPWQRLPRTVDWEGLVGVHLFSWTAGVALVFAAIFFLRYSIDHGWLSPPIRLAIGLAVGTGLLVGCELRVARRYATTANALDAAGIATLFASLFAGHALWDLVPQIPTFLAMALVAAVAVALSIRRDSPFIALLGLVGGFATPALLSTGENRPIGLFGYLLLLNLGLAWVAHRKRWPVLTALTIACTTIYQWGWVLAYLDQSPLPLALAIFLVFPLVQWGALAVMGRPAGQESPLAENGAVVAAVVPLSFAVYLAAIPSYGAHTALLFGFTLLIGAGLALVAALRGPRLLHLAGAFGTVLTFVLWCGSSYTPAAWPSIVGWVGAAVLLYVLAPPIVTRWGGTLGAAGRLGGFAAAAVLIVFTFLASQPVGREAPLVLFGSLLVMVGIVAARALATGDAGPHYLGAVIAILTQSVWSSSGVGEHVFRALGIYTVFGLFYVAVPLIAAGWKRPLAASPGHGIVLVGSLVLVLGLAMGPDAGRAGIVTGIGLVLAFTNVALATLPQGRFSMALRVVALVVTWFVLGAWWMTAMVPALFTPFLLVVMGLGLVGVAGFAWRASAESTPGRDGIGLAFAVGAHVFLARLAVDPDLALPPWPLFGALAVLDLAIAVGALVVRDGRAHVAATVASMLVLVLWGTVAPAAPWPLVAMGMADALVLLAVAWVGLAKRRGAPVAMFGRAAVVGVTLAQLVTILAAEAEGAPAIGWIAGQHVVLLGALLAVADDLVWPRVTLLALVPTTLAAGLWVVDHAAPGTWPGAFWFAVAPHAVFAAYAWVVAGRLQPPLHPFVATLLSGAVSLVLARRCLLAGGWSAGIGLVPVVQALATLAVLRRLVARRERPSSEDGTVALVAATVLGFLTVAVPLALSREWLTVAWALETAGLAWLFHRLGHRRLLLWVGGLAIVVFVRLVLNPAVLTYHPRSGTPVWNWYLYTYLVSAAALYAAAAILRATDDRVPVVGVRWCTLLPIAATIVLFLLVNIEIADAFATGPTLTFDFLSSSLAQDLTYTICWGMFALGLLGVGIGAASRGVRGSALALLMVTIVKCFLHDLWRLGGLYRVGSFVGLAVCLSLVALLLQRFVFLPKEEPT